MASSSTAAVEIDASIWHAIAGATVSLPAVNSAIYYFPQGHLEHCSAAANHNFTHTWPWIPCQVISVRYLTDSVSDQVFSRMILQPLQLLDPLPTNSGDGISAADDDILSFAKILTRSDANNGGGFSVPRFCADLILPPLNFEADPPVQTLVTRDSHNHAWGFRHIYRGTPRRHLLTTGWSKFVNAKRLVAGDSVVFMKKKSTDELFVGIRRAERFGSDEKAEAAEAVSAIESAVRGLRFEVVYYPKVGSPDFVVTAEKVNEALRIPWSAGMKVRMAVDADDASRLAWIQGGVTAASTPLAGIWRGSPWRMLQVNWDDPEGSHTNVSPWEVEYLPFSPLIDTGFHPAKRLRFLPDPGIIETDSSLLRQYPPAGMQGARRNHMEGDGLQPPTNEPAEEVISISTELTIGRSYSDTVSPVSQDGVQSGTSFQLFGTMIPTSTVSTEPAVERDTTAERRD
ncbi:Arf17p [Salvia divinorum]|uniref:Auxin response factor n=1 Tax=Salvia divinorum TaxID=28513 RepID=A0ABD1HKQ3_SALDI